MGGGLNQQLFIHVRKIWFSSTISETLCSVGLSNLLRKLIRRKRKDMHKNPKQIILSLSPFLSTVLFVVSAPLSWPDQGHPALGGQLLLQSALLLLLGKLRFERSDRAEVLLMKLLHKRYCQIVSSFRPTNQYFDIISAFNCSHSAPQESPDQSILHKSCNFVEEKRSNYLGE